MITTVCRMGRKEHALVEMILIFNSKKTERHVNQVRCLLLMKRFLGTTKYFVLKKKYFTSVRQDYVRCTEVTSWCISRSHFWSARNDFLSKNKFDIFSIVLVLMVQCYYLPVHPCDKESNGGCTQHCEKLGAEADLKHKCYCKESYRLLEDTVTCEKSNYILFSK